MALYAIDEIDDAFRVTREFLVPVDLRQWLKLAFVVFFVGGIGTNVGSFQFNAPAGGETTFPIDRLPYLGADAWLLVAGVGAVVVLLALAFLLVGSVMEFVLVESLRTETVRVREFWGRRWRQGVRLFGFRLVVGVLLLAGFAALLAPIVLGALDGEVTGGAVGLFLVGLPLFLLLALVVSLVNGFTTVFVVPIMVLTDAGVLAGWRRLWPTIRSEWKQYVVYALVNLVLTVAAGLFLAMAGLAAALVLLLPFGLLGVAGAGLLALVGPVGVAVLAVAALLYALSVVVVVAVAQVPIVTYLRYYAMLVLGDVDADLDLVARQRAAVREPESGTAA